MEIKHNITSTAYTDTNTHANESLDWSIGNRLISSNAKVKVKRITVQGYITKDLWKILIRFETVDYKLMITLQVVCCLLKTEACVKFEGNQMHKIKYIYGLHTCMC